MNVLILGGTTEASALATALATHPRIRPLLSLAGRTRTPVLPAIPARRGGFGGTHGLAAYLRNERMDALIDATHPFAARMQCNAAAAAVLAAVPRLKLLRPQWARTPGDRWTDVPTMIAAAAALGPTPRRVFLTVGRQELPPFLAAPWHAYLIRSIETPPILPPNARSIAARGPFHVADELRLLQDEAIEVLVTKNSGGTATAAKLEAARTLGLQVLMVRRPPTVQGPQVHDVQAALAWLGQLPP